MINGRIIKYRIKYAISYLIIFHITSNQMDMIIEFYILF